MPMPPLRGAFTPSILLAGGPVCAEVVTLTPVADTALWELDPDFNFGRDRSLPAGAIGNMFPADGERARVLYKFDVTGAVPAGATIEAVCLTLRRTGNIPPSSGVSDFALARVLIDWGEGNNRGEGPGGQEANDPGEATWINRMHPSTGWSAPGGVFGVDFASEQSALVEDVDAGSIYIMHFNATGVADVQAIGMVPNYGWVFPVPMAGPVLFVRVDASVLPPPG